MSGSTHLSTWVTAETKLRFGVVAAQLGLSESAFLKRLVDLNLQSTQAATVTVPEPAANHVRGARFSVRLRPHDRSLLAERAAARGIATATYASIVLRTHLRAVAPFPERVLIELKREEFCGRVCLRASGSSLRLMRGILPKFSHDAPSISPRAISGRSPH